MTFEVYIKVDASYVTVIGPIVLLLKRMNNAYTPELDVSV